MKIAVIGAGIVGVTTAYELARDGHAVTVFERRSATAEEASFANAGLIAPGRVTPWTAPGRPGLLLAQLLLRQASVRLGWPLRRGDLQWARDWCRASRQPESWLANRAQMRRLASYSQARLHTIRAELRLDYDRSTGCLVLLRSERDRHLVQPGLQLLRDAGVPFVQLEPSQARTVEPALRADTPLAAAIELPNDEVGNCRQVALMLKNAAQRLGVQFRFQTTVKALALAPGPSLAIDGAPGAMPFDAVVVCAGVGSAPLLQPLGMHLPLAAVHGYSLSAPIKEPLNAPRSAVLDEHHQVVITRLGNRIRVSGGADLGGPPAHKRAAALRRLYQVLQDWFPGAAGRGSVVQEWKGSQSMFPDGSPVVGTSAMAGLWLNLGHGSSGWAMACGSARALADQIGGRSPELDMQAFALARVLR